MMKSLLSLFMMLPFVPVICAETGSPDPEISVKECFFSERPAENWESAIPRNAKKIPFSFGRLLDFDQITGRSGKHKEECVLYLSLQTSQEGNSDFGFGSDWWSEGYINGKRCFSTMENGNASLRFSPENHPFTLPLQKGDNLLAVKVRRGMAGWKFVCGPIRYQAFRGEIPWRKGTPPPPLVPSGKSYRLIVLGDLHYDTEETVYHADYREADPRLNRIQRAEFARNAAMWETREPRMMAAAASQITPETLAVIQVGDLIQGDCGNPLVHSRMLLDTLHDLKRQFKGLPVLTVAGNHDVRGSGAESAYRKTMPAYHTKELKRPVSGTTFYTFLGGDLFLFLDFNDPDPAVIKEAMAAKARYKFVICHGPVLPSDDENYRWFLYGKNDDWRRITHRLFMQNDVIVLTGHVHDVELTECITSDGRITQLMANSVWPEEELATHETIFSEPSEYGTNRKSEDGKKLFGEYREVITRYWKARGAGYFVLDVTPTGITAHCYAGDSRSPFRKITVR